MPHLIWEGLTGGTVLTVDQVRDSTYDHYLIEPGINAFGVGIDYDQSGLGVVTTEVEFNDIDIHRPTLAGVRIGHSQIGNADLATWHRLRVKGDWNAPAGDGMRIEYVQAKVHRLTSCSFAALAAGIHVVAPPGLPNGTASGSFQASKTNFSTNAVDLLIESTSGDGCYVAGFYSERSTRLLVTGPPTSWHVPITIANGRWATDRLAADGKAIIYNGRGVLNLESVIFLANLKAGLYAQPNFQIACQPDSIVNAIGCTFPNLNPIPVGRVTMLGCMGFNGTEFVPLPNRTVG